MAASMKRGSVKIPLATKNRTKTEIYGIISEITDLPKSKVGEVFDALSLLVEMDLGKKGPQQFTIPGLCKFTTTVKPATPERPGRNPFTGEEIMIKAKPARRVVKIRPLKALKDMVT